MENKKKCLKPPTRPTMNGSRKRMLGFDLGLGLCSPAMLSPWRVLNGALRHSL